MRTVYEKTLFRDDENAYTIFAVNAPDCKQEYTNRYGNLICCGNIPQYAKGMPLEIDGQIKDSKYGYILQIERIKETSNDKEITTTFLQTIDGIGKKTAEKIVEITGADIWEYISRYGITSIEKLLNKKNRDNFEYEITSKINQREIFELINKYGGTFSNAIELCKNYKNPLVSLRKNPYVVGAEAGFNFNICDLIAYENGIVFDDKVRANAILKVAMENIEASGDCYAEPKPLIEASEKVQDNSPYKEKIHETILSETSDDYFVLKVKENKIYTKKMYNNLTDIAKRIVAIQRAKHNTCMLDYDKLSDELTEEQKKAITFIKTSGIKILTGGPGTGKTFTLKEMVNNYDDEKEIALCAPTGRAAQKMSEVIGRPATTIHRLLKFKPYGNSFECKNENDKLEADLVIVDEVSMLDVNLFALLLKALKDDVTLILVGDEFQLPSVGPGTILKDLIEMKIPIQRLTKIQRQDEESNIVKNANVVKNACGQIMANTDFIFETLPDDDDLPNKLMKYYKMYNGKMQILTPTKKGPCGTEKINKMVAKYLYGDRVKAKYGNNIYTIGSKVLMHRNNYEKNYFNGDVGTIKDINEDGILVETEAEEFFVDRDNMNDISLSYAMTIHKSQGSEYDCVAILLPNNPQNMLQRKLLYTAITRAKKRVIIIESKGAFKTAVLTENTNSRNSNLINFVEKERNK